MKSIKMVMIIIGWLSITACNAQIKNATTSSVKIYGNCAMCESNIEKAGNVNKVSKVDWNQQTKMATLTFDASKTNQDEILKRIALAGYDSDGFLAPADVYAKLPECCQYDRGHNKDVSHKETIEDHSLHNQPAMTDHSIELKQESDQLKPVFENYFALKDALVASDGALASAKAKDLLTAINAVKMEKLTSEQHTTWMKVMKDLALDTEQIEQTKDAGRQRDHFNSLSDNMYHLLKVSKLDKPTYYQHCPMANDGKGANWLSLENEIRNPYYGAQMLTCGKTVEKFE